MLRVWRAYLELRSMAAGAVNTIFQSRVGLCTALLPSTRYNAGEGQRREWKGEDKNHRRDITAIMWLAKDR